MGGGGGGGGGFFNNLVNNLNSAVQFVSGYDPRTGDWSTHGSEFQITDELVGGVTGRNTARASMNLARDSFNQSQQQAQALVAQNNWNKQQADSMASSSAGAATATSRATSGVNPNTSTPTAVKSNPLGTSGASKDFLGL